MMLNKLVDGGAGDYADGVEYEDDEDDEDSPTRRWCVACASHPHSVSRMIVDVCSRRTGLAPIISRLVLKHTPGLVHLPVHWSPSDEEHGHDVTSNVSVGKDGDGREDEFDDPMSPAPLLLAIRNRLSSAHGTDTGLSIDAQERHVEAKGIGALLHQILSPAEITTPGSCTWDTAAAADSTSVLLHCVLPTLHINHPSLLAALVVLHTMSDACFLGCAEPVMHMLRESLQEVASSAVGDEICELVSEVSNRIKSPE